VAVLRASGRDFNVDEFVAEHGLPVDVVWRRGEQNRRGVVREESGFNLTVAEVSSAEALHQELSEFLQTSHQMGAGLAAAGAKAEVDVGLMIYAAAPRSVVFPPDLLAALATEGIALRVTGYPCSDEGSDEQAT
jgi:hypothetical protein